MADDTTSETPDLQRKASLRALAEDPTVRPSIRVAARKALRRKAEAARASNGSRKPARKLN
jgi:hypothetical protein